MEVTMIRDWLMTDLSRLLLLLDVTPPSASQQVRRLQRRRHGGPGEGGLGHRAQGEGGPGGEVHSARVLCDTADFYIGVVPPSHPSMLLHLPSLRTFALTPAAFHLLRRAWPPRP